MYLKPEQSKRGSGAFVRSISQHFECKPTEKLSCKGELKDLDQLKNVHLVKNRRQLFEDSAACSPETVHRGYERNHSAASDSKCEVQTCGGKFFGLKENRNPLGQGIVNEKDNGEVVRRRKNEKSAGNMNDFYLSQLNASTAEPPEISSTIKEDAQGKVENYRSYVINSIIDAYNDENEDTGDITNIDNEELASIETCEEVINEMIKSEARKSLYALTISHKFIQSLLNTGDKGQQNDVDGTVDIPEIENNVGNSTIESVSYSVDNDQRRGAGAKRDSEKSSGRYGFKPINIESVDHVEVRGETAVKRYSERNSDQYSFKRISIESEGAENYVDSEGSNFDSPYFTSDSESTLDSAVVRSSSISAYENWKNSEFDCGGEPVLINYKTRTDPNADEFESINKSTEIINRAISNIVSVGNDFPSDYSESKRHSGNYEVGRYIKRKPRLSRFNRPEISKQKNTYGVSDVAQKIQIQDCDDCFGDMINDADDYCVEAINADGGAVLNRISLQRICISNLLQGASLRSADYNRPKMEEENKIRYSLDLEEISFQQDNLHCSSVDVNVTTYYDENSNPRIEKVIDENRLHVTVDVQLNQLVPPASPTLPDKKQNLIIKELLETELTFIEGLRIIVEEYKAYFMDHRQKVSTTMHYVFGNVEDMYEAAQDFCADLNWCDYDVDKIASAFLDHKYLFDLFVEYIRNKPASQFYSHGMFQDVIKERQAQLQMLHPLESYLLTPIQRLGRYILFMENLQKVAKTMNKTYVNLDEATEFLKTEMRRADTFVAIDSIGNCPHDLTKKGAFVAKEAFPIKKKYKSVVFLFQEIIIFTTKNQQKTESYFYRDSIDMSDLNIRTVDDEPLIIHLRNFSKCKTYQEDSPHNFELEAPSEKVAKKWVNEIEKLLWNQLEQYKEIAKHTEPVYKKSKNASQPNISLPQHYRKKKQVDAPTSPYSASNERKSVFYVDC